MIVNDIKYKLPETNYVLVESIKKQIVIGHTNNHSMRHFIGWTKRHNGKYKKTAPFTIDINGTIHQHFDPKYQSKFFGNVELDNKSIVILIENEGHLIKDEEKNRFITWNGDIYNRPSNVIEKKWRDNTYWCKYSNKQFESALILVRQLCNEFYIPLVSIEHNTKIDDIDDFKGILYRSNLDKLSTDLSPAWDCIKFKEKLKI